MSRWGMELRLRCGRSKNSNQIAPTNHIILEVQEMAQKVVGFIKLQIPAGKATPAPPVGPALGQHGVNIKGES